MSEADDSEPVSCTDEIKVLAGTAPAEQGWEQRTVGDPTRIGELEQLYTSIGFETKTTKLDPTSFGSACTGCVETACSNYIALFTRDQEPSD